LSATQISISDNGAKQFPDTGGKSHRQRAPERHSGGAAQNKARKPNDVADTRRTSAPVGDTTIKGMAAQTVNDAADVSAACTGCAVVISEIPNSSRA
jgi:hypothetical protein